MKEILVFLITFNLLLLQSCNIAKQKTVEENTSTVDEFVTIKDIKNKDVFFFSKSEVDIPEANTTKSIRLKRTSENLQAATVYIAIISEATYEEDWQNLEVDGVAIEPTQTAPIRAYGIPFSQGATSVTISFEVLNDNSFEGIESMMFMLKPDLEESYEFKFPSVVNFKFIDSTNFPSVSLTAPASIEEGQANTITLALDAVTTKTVRVPIVVSGSASDGDHNLNSQVVTIPPGETEVTIDINVENDTYNEPTETIEVSLVQPINANLSENSSGIIEITDTSGAATASFTSISSQEDEDGGTVDITLSLTGTLSQNINVPFIVSGSATRNRDFTVSSNSFSFNSDEPNPTSTITITINDDDVYELDETVIIALLETDAISLGANTTHTLTINNDESIPTVLLSSASSIAAEGTTYFIPFRLSGVSELPTVISFNDTDSSATVGSDYNFNFAANTITIPAGVQFLRYPLTILQDNAHDPNETISFQMSNATNATVDNANKSHTITIVNQGEVPSVSFEVQQLEVNENGASAQVTLNLSRTSSQNLPINLRLDHLTTDSSDFTTPSLTQTVPANSTSHTFNISITNDTTHEPNEKFILYIESSNNYLIGSTPWQEVTIINDDSAPNLSITIAIPTLDEDSDDYKGIIAVLDQPSGYDIYVPLTILESSTATENVDYTIDSEDKTIFIPKGSTTGFIKVYPVHDNIYEPNESIVFRASEDNLYNITTGQRTLTITESSAKPTLSYSFDDVINLEENSNATIGFELSGPTHGDVDVYLSIMYESDTCGDPGQDICASQSDFEMWTETMVHDESSIEIKVTIPSGQTRGHVAFKTLNDNLYLAGELKEFNILMNTFNNQLVEPLFNEQKFAVIHDTNNIPRISFDTSSKAISFDEGSSTQYIPVYLDTATIEDVTFNISTRSASESTYPTYSSDFTLVDDDNTLNPNTNPGGELLQTIQLTVPAFSRVVNLPISFNGAADDNYYDPNEKFEVIIESLASSASGNPYTINTLPGSDGKDLNVFTVTIIDDESYPSLQIRNDSNVNFEGSTGYTPNPIEMPEGTLTANSYAANMPSPQNTNWNVAVTTQATATNTTLKEIIVKVEPLHQHENIEINFSIGGSATIADKNIASDEDTFVNYDYHLYDRVEDQYITGDFTKSIPSVNDATLFNGYMSLYLAISNDPKYELDENIQINLQSASNASIDGDFNYLNYIIQNDDTAPKLVYVNSNYPAPTMKEYNRNNFIQVKVEGTGPFLSLEGSSATDLPVSFKTKIVGVKRSDNQEVTLKESIVNLDSNHHNYNHYITFDAYDENIGDYRKYSQIKVQVSDLENLSSGTNLNPKFDWNEENEYYEDTFNFTYDDIIASASKTGLKTYLNEGEPSSESMGGHTCSVFRGLVSCWGLNQYGQIGKPDIFQYGHLPEHDITSKENTLDLGEYWGLKLYAKDVATSEESTCVLFTNHKVKCFGRNYYGELGLGLDRTISVGRGQDEMGDNLPFLDLGPTPFIHSIHSMRNSFCILYSMGENDTGKKIKCWGSNSNGELGVERDISRIGDNPDHMGYNLEDVKIATESIDIFRTGGNHACIKNGGDTLNNLYCWGDYDALGLNNGSNADMGDEFNEMNLDNIKVQLTTTNSMSITDIALGDNHTCVRYADGLDYTTFNTRCWGSNSMGQLGTGRTTRFTAVRNYLAELDTDTSNLLHTIGIYPFAITQNGGEMLDRDGKFPNPDMIDSCYSRFQNIPYDQEVSNDVSGYCALNFGLERNQFVNQFFPAEKIYAGLSYTCGVYGEYLDPTSSETCQQNTRCTVKKHVRCWGSNLYELGDGIAYRESGVLNNYGYSDNFDGNIYDGDTVRSITPFVDSGFGTKALHTSSCTGTPYTDASDVCKFIDRRTIIGDDSNNDVGDSFFRDNTPVDNTDPIYPDYDYQYGFAKNYANLPEGLFVNLEMNSDYGRVRIDFEKYVDNFNDLKLFPGFHHICAAPGNNLTEGDNVLICWGANLNGQTGIPRSFGYAVGGRSSTGPATGRSNADGTEGLKHEFNYIFE